MGEIPLYASPPKLCLRRGDTIGHVLSSNSTQGDMGTNEEV